MFSFSRDLTDYSVVMLSFASNLESSFKFPNIYSKPENIVQEMLNSWQRLTQSYIKFLVAFESNEIFFQGLSKMKTGLSTELNSLSESQQSLFVNELIYIDQKELKSNLKKIKTTSTEMYEKTADISVFFDDFRKAMQNEIFYPMLKKKIPQRKPIKGYKVLTKKGFKEKTDNLFASYLYKLKSVTRKLNKQ